MFWNTIGGQALPATSGAVLASVDPSTGAVWAHVPRSNERDVDRAVAAASGAPRAPRLARAAGGQPPLVDRTVGVLRRLPCDVGDHVRIERGLGG